MSRYGNSCENLYIEKLDDVIESQLECVIASFKKNAESFQEHHLLDSRERTAAFPSNSSFIPNIECFKKATSGRDEDFPYRVRLTLDVLKHFARTQYCDFRIIESLKNEKLYESVREKDVAKLRILLDLENPQDRRACWLFSRKNSRTFHSFSSANSKRQWQAHVPLVVGEDWDCQFIEEVKHTKGQSITEIEEWFYSRVLKHLNLKQARFRNPSLCRPLFLRLWTIIYQPSLTFRPSTAQLENLEEKVEPCNQIPGSGESHDGSNDVPSRKEQDVKSERRNEPSGKSNEGENIALDFLKRTSDCISQDDIYEKKGPKRVKLEAFEAFIYFRKEWKRKCDELSEAQRELQVIKEILKEKNMEIMEKDSKIKRQSDVLRRLMEKET